MKRSSLGHFLCFTPSAANLEEWQTIYCTRSMRTTLKTTRQSAKVGAFAWGHSNGWGSYISNTKLEHHRLNALSGFSCENGSNQPPASTASVKARPRVSYER